MKSTSIPAQKNNVSISYNELLEQIKSVPAELLGEISQYVGFVLYKNSLKSNAESFEQKLKNARRQTEKYCTKDIADELAADNYMIGKPFPDGGAFDMEQAIADDAADEPAPDEWLKKMFPEVYA